MYTAIAGRRQVFLLMAAILITNSGCFLQTISGATFQAGNSLITTVQTDSILATCVQGGFGSANLECTYFFLDENGLPIEVTSSADLISEFGIFGVVIDPLIYQIPADATSITGTYDDGSGASGNLDILSGYRSIPIDTQRTLLAEPGTIFVIAELPDGVPFEDTQFSFSLTFEQPMGAATPVVVKPLLALKYSTADKVFYPPFLPCVDNMAAVPSFTIPESPTQQPLQISVNISGCVNEFYPLLGFGVFPCDFNADDDVDADDIAILASVRNSPALPGDRLDANSDGIIDLNDARRCARQCLEPRCAISTMRNESLHNEMVAVNNRGTASLSLQPAAITAGPGSMFSVDVVLAGLGDGEAPSFADFDIDIGFDPLALGLLNIGLGSELGDANLGEAIDAGFGQTISGVFNLAAVSFLSDAELNSIQPAGPLVATLDFMVLELGPGDSTMIDVMELYALGDALGDPIAVVGVSGAEITGAGSDTDADGVGDADDNCTLVSNADQRDTDLDDIGNICDPDVAAPNDCLVNFLDLNVYRANFFQAGDLDTDNTGDGFTNFLDLNIVRNFFFQQPGPSAVGCN